MMVFWWETDEVGCGCNGTVVMVVVVVNRREREMVALTVTCFNNNSSYMCVVRERHTHFWRELYMP